MYINHSVTASLTHDLSPLTLLHTERLLDLLRLQDNVPGVPRAALMHTHPPRAVSTTHKLQTNIHLIKNYHHERQLISE